MLKILVIRNDKLGDFMLAWPALALLKKQYPDSIISVLIPAYTKPMAEICDWIDEIIIDDKNGGTLAGALNLASKIYKFKFDISISLYSEMKTALAVWLAKIPCRIGPATKIAQVFLNKTLKQKRSLSSKPEYEYNTDLVKHLITLRNETITANLTKPYLSFNKNEIAGIKSNYLSNKDIIPETILIIIHPGTGGSAINLSLTQFADLASYLNQKNKVHFILTAGPDEEDVILQLSSLMKNISHSTYHSIDGIVEFSKFINICDLFISGSTGPLHIAGALDIPTAAFYPARRSATPLRWKTLNSKHKRISISPQSFRNENDMQTINIETSSQKIQKLLDKTHKPS